MLNRMGVRWFMPGEFGEVVPKTDTIRIDPVSLTERPSFAIRSYWSHSKNKMDQQRRQWQTRNLMNPGG